MYKNIYILFFFILIGLSANAQTTIFDFETAATSPAYQYFGSTLDGMKAEVIDNPNATGINKSAKVMKFVKPAVAEVWAGAFANPTTLVDVSSTGVIKIKVHMDHIGNLALKLENSTNGGENWIITVPNTKVNEWEELTFDPALPSIEGSNKPAKGFIYKTAVLFFDFGTPGSGKDVLNYVDDMVLSGGDALVCRSILDFESEDGSTKFQYFGSTLDGMTNEVIANPNPTGLNTSAKVSKFIKPAVAEVWAGAFSNPDPKALIDLKSNSKIKVKVHMDHIGNLAMKLEGASEGGANWIITVPNTKINEWEELEFDVNLPSIEAPNKPAKGFTYSRIVLFFDFGVAGNGKEVVYYFDDICQIGAGAPTSKKVNFTVDMNNYTSNFDKVYLSGTFNNWAGDANPLTDTDGDGIWTGSIDLPVGLYEYKVTLDNWKAEEKFIGTEECTLKDPTGQFVNRKLTVSGDLDIPKLCFNSCYACGEELKITFKLGMGQVVPSPEGVWIAGGGNFDVPGGKYKMNDDDMNGIYELVVPRKAGFSSFFTFVNGPCPDYSCKEILEGQSCANPSNFNDRFLPAITGNVTYESCFGICSDNTACTTSTYNYVSTNDIFELWGNPTTSSSTLYFNNGQSAKKIEVINNVGQTVRTFSTDGNQSSLEIDTQVLSIGFYTLKVVDGNKMQTSKLIKF